MAKAAWYACLRQIKSRGDTLHNEVSMLHTATSSLAEQQAALSAKLEEVRFALHCVLRLLAARVGTATSPPHTNQPLVCEFR